MSDAQTIREAWYSSHHLRPHRSKPDVLQAITPPGGEWQAVAKQGAITRSVVWRGLEVAQVNPAGTFDDLTEGQITMGIRATPVLDAALRTILTLARDGADPALIASIAETAIAYIEMPAPACRAADDEDEPSVEDDEEPR